MKKVILIILILIKLLVGESYNNYTGLTEYKESYPNIAIDMEKEYKDDYIRKLWKNSKKNWSK